MIEKKLNITRGFHSPGRCNCHICTLDDANCWEPREGKCWPEKKLLFFYLVSFHGKDTLSGALSTWRRFCQVHDKKKSLPMISLLIYIDLYRVWCAVGFLGFANSASYRSASPHKQGLCHILYISSIVICLVNNLAVKILLPSWSASSFMLQPWSVRRFLCFCPPLHGNVKKDMPLVPALEMRDFGQNGLSSSCDVVCDIIIAYCYRFIYFSLSSFS